MTSRWPLRVKVATAFAVTTALAMTAFALFLYVRVERGLTAQTRSSVQAQLAALVRVPAVDRPAAVEALSGEFFAQLLTPQGAATASSPQLLRPVVAAALLPTAADRGVLLERAVDLAGEEEAEASVLGLHRDGGQVVLVGTSTETVEDALDGVLTQLLVGGPLALALASALGYVVAGGALRPVEAMRREAAGITARSSDERLTLPTAHDEVHRLGATLNAMLDRLSGALQRERRFVAEASHELRTPLALLRMELDLALSRPRTEDELLAALHSADEEVQRLSRLAEDLLLLATPDGSGSDPRRRPVDVDGLLRALAERFEAATAHAARALRVHVPPGLQLSADPALLDRAVSNLVDNALRHGAGDVELRAGERGARVWISVTDHGQGVEPARREQAFDPFHRGTRARSGRGLGLAIVSAIVADHGGTVSLTGLAGGSGTVVTIELPAA